MPRKKVIERRTTISVDTGMNGWLEFVGRAYPRGYGQYLNELAKADRERVLASEPDTAEKYRAFLVATDRQDELELIAGTD